MEYRSLGASGLKVSPLCLGSMQFGWTADRNTSFTILSAAYEAGINFIDTADIYSNWVEGNPGGVAEEIIGDWMKSSGIPRHHLVIATKVRGRMGKGANDEGLSRAHILTAIEASLKRLKTDYIDLYQTHWYDSQTPILETLSALDDLIRQGKVRYLGCSNYPAWRLTEAIWAARTHQLAEFVSFQPHYNLVHRQEFESEAADVCRAYGLGVIPYSPLAGGFLTGKYRPDHQPESARLRNVSRYFNERNWRILETLETIAQQKECTISQVSLAWLLANPLITSPIIGPRDPEQLLDNLGAIKVSLEPKEIEKLNEVSRWQ